MSDAEFLLVAAFFAVFGYATARLLDKCQDIRDRQAYHETQVAEYLRQRRVMLTVQERAELDDLRDYARRRDA